jgi:hypothetical protein
MQAALQRFKTEIQFCKDILTLAFEQDLAGVPKHNPTVITFLVDSAYVRFWIAWEGFLEQCFHNYMLGMLSTTGTIVSRHVTPTDLQHAQKMIIGINRYFDWSNPDYIVKTSIHIFGIPNPFESTLKSIFSSLSDMKAIRNSAAHISSTTQSSLDAAAHRILGTPTTNISTSDLLMRNIGGTGVPTTVFQNFMTILDVAAEVIAKA